MRRSAWLSSLLVVACIRLAVGVVGFGWSFVHPGEGYVAVPPYFFLILLLAFAAVGLFLVRFGQADSRSVYLGCFFVLLATVFTNRPLAAVVAEAPPVLVWPARMALAANVDAFLPWIFWLFAAEFPEQLTTLKARRLFRAGQGASLVLAATLFVWQTSLDLAFVGRAGIHPSKATLGYYAPLLLATAVPLVLVLVRALRARAEESRRARLFAAGLVLGLGPTCAMIAAGAVWPDALMAIIKEGGWRLLLLQLLFFPCLLSVPFTTAYAVLFQRLFQVKHIARRALQYALARYSAIALAVIPLIALGIFLVFNRAEKLEDIFAGSRLPLLVGAAAIGLAALRYRKTLLDAIDRQFFREQYDARRILTLLVERIRATRTTADLAQLVAREIDLALHLEGVTLLSFDPRSGQLTDPRDRGLRLDGSSPLVSLIAAGSEPAGVDLEDPRSLFSRLPEAERFWLVDSGFRLVVPILARDGSLLGLIGLGEKKSGLPFLKEDRQLLRAIASNAAWVLELEQGLSLSSRRSWQDTPPTVADEVGLAADETQEPPVELAKECPQCGRVFQSFTVLCRDCSRRLEPSPVPFTLMGKFRFEKRIGTGGMGVVYRASDLALGRAVAIKTLRRVSPEDAMRLRREARTAAAVSHPHLASVYGMETWQGTPLLVMELLEGGTLAQRIQRGPLEPLPAIELGIAMAEALEHLHRADILHRDVKPSNIGFSRQSVPKLMDFGIARAMFDVRKDVNALSSSDDADLTGTPKTVGFPPAQGPSVSNQQLVGTLGYLSPEAIDGRPPDVSFDLWGLCIVLFESLLGRKVFTGDVHQVMGRIRQGRVPDFSQLLPDGEPALAEFFRCVLHRTLARRPASARELRERLVALRERLAPSEMAR